MFQKQNIFLVDQNFEKAAEWYQRSMDHDGYYGKLNLAFLLMNGFGVEKNVDLAKQYYDEILKGDYEYWAKEDLLITAKEYEKIVDPKKMISPY